VSYWKIVILFMVCLVVQGCHQRRLSSINIMDGRPIKNLALENNVVIDFDGANLLTVSASSMSFTIDPKTPSFIQVSPDGQYLLNNFGDGSGQVYQIEIYDLKSKKFVSVGFIHNAISSFIESIEKCSAKPDEISYIFSSWASSRTILFKTEDFSRSGGCSQLNRSWNLTIP